MQALLRIARAVDRLNTGIGRALYWLILVATLVSAGNALMRYTFDISSNAWLELQWYLFSAVFLLCAPYTLQRNEMVRIDVIAGRLSRRAQAWIDLVGTLLFLLPMTLVMVGLSWPVFVRAYASHEMSSNAGGLILWPARMLVPLGFFLLLLQGLSELIKRVAFLAGAGPDPLDRGHEKSAEALLAEDVGASREDRS
jgi:TRAP-type mannitol/chloroaromatic compound transport system permease small subunit